MKWPSRPMQDEGTRGARTDCRQIQGRELRGAGGQGHSLWVAGTFANESPRIRSGCRVSVVGIKQGFLLSAGPGRPLMVSANPCK